MFSYEHSEVLFEHGKTVYITTKDKRRISLLEHSMTLDILCTSAGIPAPICHWHKVDPEYASAGREDEENRQTRSSKRQLTAVGFACQPRFMPGEK